MGVRLCNGVGQGYWCGRSLGMQCNRGAFHHKILLPLTDTAHRPFEMLTPAFLPSGPPVYDKQNHSRQDHRPEVGAEEFWHQLHLQANSHTDNKTIKNFCKRSHPENTWRSTFLGGFFSPTKSDFSTFFFGKVETKKVAWSFELCRVLTQPRFEFGGHDCFTSGFSCLKTTLNNSGSGALYVQSNPLDSNFF